MAVELRRRLGLLPIVGRHPVVARDVAGALSRGAFGEARHMLRTVLQSYRHISDKIISRKYRFLWISVPKVASRSLIAALHNAVPDAETIIETTLPDIMAMHPEVEGYYSFAFVRHPFARAFSWYRETFFSPEVYNERYHLYRDDNSLTLFDPAARRHMPLKLPASVVADPSRKEEKQRGFFTRYYGLEDAAGFDDVCRWLNTVYGSDDFADPHFSSQSAQIRFEDGRLPDFVGRLESIERDLERVARRTGMPVPALPVFNTMAGWQPPSPDALEAARSEISAHLSEQNKQLLTTRYADDMELGGYSPEWDGLTQALSVSPPSADRVPTDTNHHPAAGN